jgi:hypothetical protein
MPNSLASEQVALLATIDPDVTTASTVVSDYVDASEFYNYMAVVLAGTLGSSATIDAKIVQATDSSGTGVKDVTGKAITQITQAGTDQSDTQAVINVKPDDLDINNGFKWFALSVTVGTATSDAGGFIVGCNPRNAPASDNDLASVGEIVS